jgi:hypothetical protein
VLGIRRTLEAGRQLAITPSSEALRRDAFLKTPRFIVFALLPNAGM